ncbi:hypothetical protein B0H13DRAFT_1907051 [Mycena leptocephala]|nr:hypothetical protein B0H13DRAFT_1907051 [Mycena leptocephala]
MSDLKEENPNKIEGDAQEAESSAYQCYVVMQYYLLETLISTAFMLRQWVGSHGGHNGWLTAKLNHHNNHDLGPVEVSNNIPTHLASERRTAENHHHNNNRGGKRVFVNNLPSTLDKEDVVVATADCSKALAMSGSLLSGKIITVDLFKRKDERHQRVPYQHETCFCVDVNTSEWSVLQLFRILRNQSNVDNLELKRIFIGNLPNNVSNEDLTAEFLKRDVQILNVSIRRAWYKDSLVADVVLAAAEYAKALGMNGTLLRERRITVKPFMPGKSLITHRIKQKWYFLCALMLSNDMDRAGSMFGSNWLRLAVWNMCSKTIANQNTSRLWGPSPRALPVLTRCGGHSTLKRGTPAACAAHRVHLRHISAKCGIPCSAPLYTVHKCATPPVTPEIQTGSRSLSLFGIQLALSNSRRQAH